MPFSKLLLSVFCLFLLPALLSADEGMWLFSKPPREILKAKYDFELTSDWLERAQKASIRFNNGGSGSFVSPDGLCVTNHHIGADSLQKLSTKDKDLYKDGFYARTRSDELKCPDLELNVLDAIEDVTKDVQAAVTDKMDTGEAERARRAVIAKIAKESQAKTGLRSDVVSLYQGGLYHLYRYKKYTDVCLVMAPEHDIASFGGDVDNFEFPRYNLDVCFFRVYEDGKPAKTPHFFPWSKTGPADGELVFVSGHPGTTNRLETLEHLRYRRDVLLPYSLNLLRRREAMLLQYADKGPEQRRHAERDLYPVANARKVLTGQYQALLEPAILRQKKESEAALRDVFAKEEAKKNPWNQVAASLTGRRDFETAFLLLEKGDAFDSRLFRIARTLVRLAGEVPKEDGQRLPEYRSSALDSLKFQLFSPAPIPRDLEKLKLAESLTFLAETLNPEHELVQKVLAGKSPSNRAAELVSGCKLDDVAERKRLFDGGKKVLDESADAMIALARLIDGEARKLRTKSDQLNEGQGQAYAALTRARFAKFGDAQPPDATFTLRLAYGIVKGYEEDGEKVPYATVFAGAFARAAEMKNREPFTLPMRWLEGEKKLDLKTPFNFTATSDTIGGNSGSPVLNKKGELVGINFDRNRHGLVRNFVYTEERARHISVHSAGVLEALRKLYDASELTRELIGE